MASNLNTLYFQPPSGSLEIQACLEVIENTSFLYKKESFEYRVETIDFIDFFILDQIEVLLQKTNQTDELPALKYLAEQVKCKLEAANIELFRELRNDIQNKGYTGEGFKSMVHKYLNFDLDAGEQENLIGYDNLDIFINSLLSFQDIPEVSKDLEPEMVFYQKTPARIVFELVEKSLFINDGVFFDLGSGLGQVAILVNLLTGITTKGVEFEPAFCEYASACAEQLNLPNVRFINEDARKADYSEGTAFFMYTPFKGS
ncbi:MAG: class I SAM-dependent methyltransferase, partial [Bacteroidetes bacterium]|nr:class I SAM-dependent methyltransferase [Bacteroidota bacterium]